MTTQTPTPVHKAVQEHYGNLAKEAGSCCEITSGKQAAQNMLYPQELLEGLPPDIANFTSRIVAMSFCEPRSCIGRLSS